VAAAFTFAMPATADLTVGVNDDAGQSSSLAPWFYPTLGAEGLEYDALTLRWDDRSPTTIPNRANLAQAIALAAANGVTVELDLYPLRSQVFTGGASCAPASDPEGCGDTAEIEQFASWTGEVARAFPTVHEFVVMNECNQPLFMNPQWDQIGQNQSAEICGRALVAAYDTLKAVSAQNFVWGVGLSPRGNDNPTAASNSSTSPVMFLQDLGAWFRAFVTQTGRTKPLMDGLDFHPYPVPQSMPFAQGYTLVNDASVSNLARLYQAFYTAFDGTPQRTIGQQPGGGLPLSLNEVGIQTDSAGRPGYVGTETSANAAGGVVGQYATESYQASWYLQMLNLVACDPNVRLVIIYHLIDEPSLAGWQSGLYYVLRTPKQSAATVHDWIAATVAKCQGTVQPWTPAGIAAAPTASITSPAQSAARIVVAAGGQLRIFDAVSHRLRRVLAPFGAGYTGPLSIALGNVNGDKVPDLAVAEGMGGGPTVKLLDGKTGRTIASFAPFPSSFTGGLTVAIGALNDGSRADLIVGTGPGIPAQVKVLDTKTHALLETLAPFGPSFRGGVSVAAGDLAGDGTDDVIVGSGAGIKATVEIFGGATSTLLESLAPFPATFRGGVSVAAGDLTGDGKADVITGSSAGMTTVVRVYAGATAKRLWSLDAFGSTFTGGTTVAAGALDGGAIAGLVLGSGAGGGSQVKVLDGKTHALLASFLAAPGSTPLTLAAG
jgi:autotransporter-associated beta strand protein